MHSLWMLNCKQKKVIKLQVHIFKASLELEKLLKEFRKALEEAKSNFMII